MVGTKDVGAKEVCVKEVDIIGSTDKKYLEPGGGEGIVGDRKTGFVKTRIRNLSQEFNN